MSSSSITRPSPSPSPSAFDVLMSNATEKKQISWKTPKRKPSKTLMRKPSKISRREPEKDSNSIPDRIDVEDSLKNGVKRAASKTTDYSNEEKRHRVNEELKKKAENFNVNKAVYWGKGSRVPFMFVVEALQAVSKESGRISITGILCNVLRTVMETSPNDLLAVVYLLAMRIAPAHEGLELGIGDDLVIKALAEAFGRKRATIKKKYKDLGELGRVANACRSSQPLMHKPQALTVIKVFETFQLIAKESGMRCQERKKDHIKALLVAATDFEAQYLIRLLQRKLRIGLAEQTLLAALGHAAVYFEKRSAHRAEYDNPVDEAVKIVKQVYSVLPVYDKIVPALLSGGVWSLPKACPFTPGIPVGSMLANQTKGVSEIVEKFQGMEFTCEYKYDGERAQIHYMENGSVEIYSRNSERVTEKFPDVVGAISRLKQPSVTSFVIDCELVAYDRQKQKIRPFQVLSTRARRNVVMSEIEVDVCIYAFDILYLNGQQFLQEQLYLRREVSYPLCADNLRRWCQQMLEFEATMVGIGSKLETGMGTGSANETEKYTDLFHDLMGDHLYKSFQEERDFFQFATSIVSNDLGEIQKFLDDAVNSSCEGLIAKTWNKDSTYEPSKRSNTWLKLKKDYMESFGDSLDLVPIAAYHGKGKRTGVYGTFLLACYDSDKDEFQSICKIGTGFSDAMLEKRSASLRSKVIPVPESCFRFSDKICPDVWFEPTEVWEVKAANLTVSPVYCAAIGAVHPDKGISLRFPRLLRVREDKAPEQASSSDMIAEMYNAQNHNSGDKADEIEDD